jgi:energy-coupling factor transporter ATP-binding protein EcfA2
VDPQLQHLILERLADEGGPGDAAADLVLAAVDGPTALAEALDGAAPARAAAPAQPELEADPPGTYVASIGVEGFRGIGPRAELELTPGPGLTVVVGRNGSGKSSFAEGLELLLTGESSRWVNRTRVWTEGWQNLHVEGETVLEARLHVDGEAGLTTLRRSWPRGEPVGPGELSVTRADGSRTGLAALGWESALARYRPFLSYNELGKMFDELRTMYDALAAILGLEDLEELHRALRDERLRRERALKDVKAEAKQLAASLAGVDDPRAKAAAEALGGRSIDVAAVEAALAGTGDGADPARELQLLRSLCSLEPPAPEAVASAHEELAGALAALDQVGRTDAARAASTADLLARALAHHDPGHGPDCPVCGAEGRLDDAWRARTEEEVARLRAEARAVHDAQAEVASARRRVAALLPAEPPDVLRRADGIGVDTAPALEAWQAWREARDSVGGGTANATSEGPAGATSAAPAPTRAALDRTATAVRALADAAAEELDRREDVWRPAAQRLAGWLGPARTALDGAQRLDALKAAEAWVKETAGDLQARRLAPIADAAKANWERLRQDSNVSLDGFRLHKSGNTRNAQVDVSVDGSEASAFGVMSQGELHALAVSVFLPRAALPASPFRFMVIDDPVQSMDPAKVDGLARVLDAAAQDRQVVVFTHDERLFDAVRRLGIDARVVEVTRRPGSVVDVRTALDPVERSIADARALLKESGLPDAVARRVVPGFCRHALEAAAVQAVRRRRLARGQRHAEVEAELDGTRKLSGLLALALFDDGGRGGDVLSSINNRWGRQRGDVYVRCNRGAHEGDDGDLRALVTQAAILARNVAELP